MIVFVSGATATMRRIGHVPHLGVFFNPNSYSNAKRQVVPAGMPWAADNAAFTRFDPDAYLRMLDTLHHRRIPNCRFVSMPDVVGDAGATLRAFWRWRITVARYGFPLAFVAQDGLIARTAPWPWFDVLFVGGSTRWKLGIQAHTLCGYAKALGKGVHIGRVNSPMRAELFADVADSIDGTATSRYGDVYIPIMTAAARAGARHGPRTPQREMF
jgi:hypothetical protein